ncbi:hypothetical protein L3N51_01249 [Metallosphaera sp. J1]|uniref:hypothetical protein n=1 Tax=Metallosphaera TaxID=41980 RepID=UPI001EDEC847|nr:hypothetical protein [Metallosphaera javensis (ex Hofmann et al. 2022)]MCG3108959.1 hypothetical protein [Metallosphaera javensis (ex Hofmann et al. 2022)]BCS92313.1 MAG: hypothetical protein MjAS7_0921 [Metallosphaera javensis (ex Sakai et al. 2022)]
MKLKEICSCSALAVVGVLVMVFGLLGKIAYFNESPDAPLYIGILLLTIASFVGLSMKSPDNREEPWP